MFGASSVCTSWCANSCEHKAMAVFVWGARPQPAVHPPPSPNLPESPTISEVRMACADETDGRRHPQARDARGWQRWVAPTSGRRQRWVYLLSQ